MKLLERFDALGEPRIAWGDEVVDAARLRGWVAAMARWFGGQGLQAGDRVGLHLPHGVEAPVCLLACWRAGLVAVPLDLHHPPGRLAALMERSGAALLVTSGRRGAAVARRIGGPEVVVSAGWLDGLEAGSSGADVGGEAPALILWTSGSTGEPKGVTVSRRAVDVFVEFWSERLSIGRDDRVAWTAALSFDLSLLDIGVSLSRGATLVPVPESQLAFPVTLADWLDEQGVTCLYTVPSLLDRAFPEAASIPPGLRVVLSAGEALSPGLCARLRRGMAAGGQLGNLFGPTETNVSTAWFVPEGWSGEQVPIGAPCPYVDVRLAENGELLVRGGTAMSGYWGQPQRARWTDGWLHTGDRAAWDGETYVFLGRMDRMVKVRGFRVEPEEVERALAALDGVREAAVVVQEGELVAWVVGVAMTQEVSDALARRLPTWACPSRIERLDALPRTPRGKIDRGWLAEATSRS